MTQLGLIRRAIVLLAICVFVADLPAQETDSNGNREYGAGRYAEAAEFYESSLRAGEKNAALFYNLGNARFRLGELGQAILQYERALALEPQHPEAAANLRLARDKARALELRKAWWDRYIARVSIAQATVAVSAGFWIATFALAALLLARRRSAVVVGVLATSILLMALAATTLYLRDTGNKGRDFAVVTAAEVEARVATADSAGTVLVLPPGSEIKILSTRGDWTYAALPNDLRGWIPAQSAERVRL